MNIGILGGTFDPIHIGHLQIAEHAKREFSLDELWFMPAGDPYFKAGRDVTPAKLRLLMTERFAAARGAGYACCDYECRHAGPTYTSETLSALSEMHPDDRFYFIIGADSLHQLTRWHEPEKLFRHAVLLCAGREAETAFGIRPGRAAHLPANGIPGTGISAPETAETGSAAAGAIAPVFPENSNESGDVFFSAEDLAEMERLNREYAAFGCEIRPIHCRKIPVSSTEIRERARRGEDISAYVTPEVLDFIRKNDLYRK